MSTNASQPHIDTSRLEPFHHFLELPVELRWRIWKLASFIPRNVDVWNKNLYFGTGTDRHEGTPVPHFMSSRTLPPAIFHICRESRTEALKHYTFEFSAERDERAYVVFSRPRIYINWDVDTVCLFQPDVFHPVPMPMHSDNHYENTDAYNYYKNTVAFTGRMEETGLKSVAFNIYMQYISTRGNNRDIDIPYLRSAELLLIRSAAFEELILFCDASCYHDSILVPVGGPVKFEDLSQVELEAISPENILIAGKKLFDAYFSWAINEDDEVREKYQLLNVHLCRVQRH